MRQFLVFSLGEENYGLDVVQLQEIVESPTLFYLPRAKPPWLGAINAHGAILPVLDLADLFGFGRAECDRRLLVLDPGICALALAITRVQGIVRPVVVEDGEDEPVPAETAEALHPAPGSCEVLSVAGKNISLLDLNRLLSRLEIL